MSDLKGKGGGQRRGAILSALADALAGALGSVIAVAAFYPVDVAKTRLQAATSAENGGQYGTSRGPICKVSPRILGSRTLSTFFSLFREEGVARAYQGMGAKAFQALIGSFIYFYAYSFIKGVLRRRKGGTLPPFLNLLAAALAGAVNVGITLPLDNITTRIQTLPPDSQALSSSQQDMPISAASSVQGVIGGEMPNMGGTCPVNKHGCDRWSCSQKRGDPGEGLTAVPARSPSPTPRPTPLPLSSADPSRRCRRLSLVEVAGQLHEEGGGNMARFWRGLVPSLILTCNPAINYSSFDLLKSLWTTRVRERGEEEVGAQAGARGASMDPKYLGALEAFILAAAAKALATMLTYPLIRAKVVMMASCGRKGGRTGEGGSGAPVSAPDNAQSYALGQRPQGPVRGGEPGSNCQGAGTKRSEGSGVEAGVAIGGRNGVENCEKGRDGAGRTDSSERKGNMWQVIVDIFRGEGLAGFYRGCSAQLLHTTLKSALLVSTRERLSILTYAVIVERSLSLYPWRKRHTRVH
ncbi:unnamed protein product [Discosporangium mesarthrocarpum]